LAVGALDNILPKPPAESVTAGWLAGAGRERNAADCVVKQSK